jgi:hypothetical protein
LAEEIRKEFPELEEYVDEVIENTGGVREARQPSNHQDGERIEVD